MRSAVSDFVARGSPTVSDDKTLRGDIIAVPNGGEPTMHTGVEFLAEELKWRPNPRSEPLAGELVTTGTLTEAMPAVVGQSWSTGLDGVCIQGAPITFSLTATNVAFGSNREAGVSDANVRIQVHFAHRAVLHRSWRDYRSAKCCLQLLAIGRREK
jgi:hypothetical protein